MAKGIELTKDEACKHPECFMYVWASNEFLNAINPQYAKIIRGKRANQIKVLMLSAEKFLGDYNKVTEYYDAIAQKFRDMYGMSPLKALVTLAEGGEVAGKNWSEGVYGVGSLRTEFTVQVGGEKITVDKKTGHIYKGTEDITDSQDGYVYATDKKGNSYLFQVFSKNVDGYVFCAQYNKTLKKYYAECYSDADGKTYNTAGKEINPSQSGSIWGSINLNWDWIKSILNWILSILGVNPIPDVDGSSETLSSENTLPNQKVDGFVSESSPIISNTGALLLLVAGGTLLMNKGKFLKANKRK